ncbi:MAG: hypothetical protein Kow00129_09550 [Thermoleophilia bacterium]
MEAGTTLTAGAEIRGKRAVVFWRTDTRALVGAVLMGLAFVVAQQLTHRVDNIFWPTLVIFGGISWATFTGLAALLFRQPAALIMGETQALIAVGTGLSPLAPFFIPANGLGALTYSLVAWRLSMQKWTHHLLAQAATNVVGNLCVAVGLRVILELPYPVIIVSSSVTALAGTVGSTILTHRLYRSVKSSGLA